MERKWSLFAGVLVTVLALTSAIFGQQRDVMVYRETSVHGQEQQGKTPAPDRTFTFVSSEMNFDGKLVKGAPYSAQAVTETTQTLADGNRIINKSESALYRDSEGRTRREQSLRAIGPFATTGEPAQTIFINDPVAGVNYSLDSRSMVARKMAPMKFEFKMFPGAGPAKVAATNGVSKTPAAGDRIEVHPVQPEIVVGSATMAARTATTRICAGANCEPEVFTATTMPVHAGTGGGMVIQWFGGPDDGGKSEPLGKQTIEGVEAEGTRNVTTIPAGKIGNERAIEIVFERWYSPELQTVVMTRHSDPRFGETIYRLTNISRDEPSRSLFEVPAGYTVKETATSFTRTTSDQQINGGVLNGKAIALPLPEYPVIARQANATGSVTVEVTVDEAGNVVSAEAVSGHPLLRAAAVNAARQAKLPPTKLSGQPIKVTGTLVYNFEK
jgi:TonB family protein